MLPEPTTIAHWIQKFAMCYSNCSGDKIRSFWQVAEAFLESSKEDSDLINTEKALFGGTRMSEIIIQFKTLKTRDSLSTFDSLKNFSHNELLARLLLCCDNKKYTWKDICNRIGFTGKSITTISTTYLRSFQNNTPYTLNEIISSMQMKPGTRLENRTSRQNREIFIQGMHLTQKAAIRTQHDSKIEDKIVSLEKELEEDEKIIGNLQNTINLLIHNKKIMDDLKARDTIVGNLSKLLDQAIKNSDAKTAARYDPELEKITVLSLITSKTEYKILHEMLGFPSDRTAISYTEKIFREMFPDTDNVVSLFDGSFEHINMLFQNFLLHIDKNRRLDVVLAIDACSLNPNVIIKDDGSVSGLSLTTQISSDEAKRIINDRSLFDSFLEDHSEEIESAAFIVLCIPLDPELPSFPIFSKETTSGSATKEIEAELFKLAETINNLGHSVIGIGCDGDVQWLHLGKDFVEMEKENFTKELHKPLYAQYKESDFKIVFYDTLHLGKNLRYYLSEVTKKCIWLTSQEPVITKEAFIACGIDAKLFDDAEQSKCYDILVRELFTLKNINKCIQANKPQLAFTILFMTLLFEAIFTEGITRQQRLDYLSIGHAIAFIYLMDLDKYKEAGMKNNEFQKDRAGKNVKKKSLYERSLIVKYLLLTYALSKHIASESAINLGALGSHLLEHFFAMMRRVSNYDSSPEAYENSIKKIVMYKHLCDELGIDIFSNKRSDSGQKLPSITGPVKGMSWGEALATALDIIEKTGIYILSYEDLEEVTKHFKPHIMQDLSVFNLTAKNHQQISMRQNYYGLISGIRRVSRFISNAETHKSVSMKPQQIRGYYQKKNGK